MGLFPRERGYEIWHKHSVTLSSCTSNDETFLSTLCPDFSLSSSPKERPRSQGSRCMKSPQRAPCPLRNPGTNTQKKKYTYNSAQGGHIDQTLIVSFWRRGKSQNRISRLLVLQVRKMESQDGAKTPTRPRTSERQSVGEPRGEGKSLAFHTGISTLLDDGSFWRKAQS